MSERFKVLRTLDSSQWDSSCDSVQLLAARILEDNQTGQQYLQVKFKNNNNSPLIGLSIVLSYNGISVADHSYSDLNLDHGDEAGIKNLVPIPSLQSDVSVRLVVKNATFEKEASTYLTTESQTDNEVSSKGKITLHRNSMMSASTKRSTESVLLLITEIFLLASLGISLLNLFHVEYSLAPGWSWNDYSINTILFELSNNRFQLPVFVPFGIYGYVFFSICAVIVCLFFEDKKTSIPFIRTIPFLPFAFQLFLTFILYKRSFVYITDIDECDFYFAICSFNNEVYLWVACAGIAAATYMALMIYSWYHEKKNDSLNEKQQKICVSRIILHIIEFVPVIVIILSGIAVSFHNNSVLWDARSNMDLAVALDRESLINEIEERYKIDDVNVGKILNSAYTETRQKGVYHFIEASDLLDSNNRQPIGALCTLAIIDIEANTVHYQLIYELDSANFSESETVITPSEEVSPVPSAMEYEGYWFNNDSTAPYYLGIQVDSSRSSPVLEIQIYSDYYRWTATAYQSTPTVFAYEDGFQQSYSEDFNLPDLAGTITFDFDKNIVIWTDEYDESIVFTNSITSDVFNAFVKKATGTTNSYGNNSQSIIEPIHLSGHYWCEQNSGDAYISMYSSPEQDGTVGNIEVYSQLEKANFSGILYSTGRNEYETIAETGASWRLCFYGSSDTPAFELYYVLPSGNYQSFGEYVLDEHYYS